MQLKDTMVSITIEVVDTNDDGNASAADGQDVTVTPTGQSSPNGHAMCRVAGTVPSLITWLSTVYGAEKEDILSDYIPRFQLKELI